MFFSKKRLEDDSEFSDISYLDLEDHINDNRKHKKHYFEDDTSNQIECPVCGAALCEQYGFEDCYCDWTCAECNALLRRDCSLDDFEVAYDDDGDDDDEDDDDNSDDSDGSSSGLVSSLAGIALGLGALAVANQIAKASAQARRENEARLERERIAEEQRKIRLAQKEKESKQRNRRIRAFFFNKKNLLLEFSTSDLVGDNVDSVVKEIEDAGFNNYKTIPIKDIYVGSTKCVGEVEQVVINGQSWLAEGTSVPYDAEILITFHMKKEFEFPYSARQMVNRDFVQLAKELINIGFTEIHTLPLHDLTTGWLKKERTVQKVMIDGFDAIYQGMLIEYDKKITLNYHSFK